MGRLSLQRSPYYRLLLEDPNFNRWISSVEEGSPTKRDVSRFNLVSPCNLLCHAVTVVRY